MSSEAISIKQTLIPPEIKNGLGKLGFIPSPTPESGVMWGFDGKTKHFPRETYIREKSDEKPNIKLKIEKTTNGFTLIINSIPFKPHNHLDRSQFDIENTISIVKEYIDLIKA